MINHPTTSYYGICNGGPYDGRPLAHLPGAMLVAYERHRPSRSIPGMVASVDPNIAFGGYVFDPATDFWRWYPEISWSVIRAEHGFPVDKKPR